jgi:Icc-related predicted phosphoesterase
MRLVCISDTHSLHKKMKQKMPPGDVLVIAGDITNKGDLQDVVNFNAWLGTLSYDKILLIAGNHDFCFERRLSETLKYITNAEYLEDSGVTYKGINFYGTPYQPEFFNWAFNLARGIPLQAVWKKIPQFTDVLITHGPPYGILDRTEEGNYTGCEDLIKAVLELKPKIHVFGHIHEAYGQKRNNDTLFVNASICDRKYRPVNKPIICDI